MSEVVYRSRVRIERENPPLRLAHIEVTDERVMFGVPGDVGEHYGFTGGEATQHAGTIDYIIAAAGG